MSKDPYSGTQHMQPESSIPRYGQADSPTIQLMRTTAKGPAPAGPLYVSCTDPVDARPNL